jgi:hypothetical protein
VTFDSIWSKYLAHFTFYHGLWAQLNTYFKYCLCRRCTKTWEIGEWRWNNRCWRFPMLLILYRHQSNASPEALTWR